MRLPSVDRDVGHWRVWLGFVASVEFNKLKSPASTLRAVTANLEIDRSTSGAVFFLLGCSQLVLTPTVDALATFTASRLPASSAWSDPAPAKTRFGLALWACC